MAVSTKIIRRRIRSIKNTKKITKAMEMVAAAKMRKAVNAVLQSRKYSHAAWQAVLNLAARVDRSKHPLLAKRKEIENIGVIVFSSNRGLCGGFNSHIFSKIQKYVESQITQKGGPKIEWITIGKKAGEYLARTKKNIIADFVKPELSNGINDITAAAKIAVENYIDHKYDQVAVVYTDYISAMSQKTRVKQLLPIEIIEDQELGSVSGKREEKLLYSEEYIFEPSIDAVLNLFLKKLVEVQIYQAMLESNASEHAARMMSMRQATDAAEDMISELTLIYNQARQASITREIAEISGGKAALEQ